MIENTIDIPLKDGKKLFCVCNFENNKKSKKAVVTVHGLTGHPYETIHHLARDHFVSQGYDVYRIALYYYGQNYRDLTDCTLKLHGEDLKQAIAFVKKSSEDVYVCGHSYGGMTMLFSNPDANALAFWDSSFRIAKSLWEPYSKPLNDTSYYLLGDGVQPILGRAMYEEAMNMTEEAENQLASKINAPSLVIGAKKAVSPERSKLLYDNLFCKKEHFDFKEADHCFWYKNTGKELMKKTQEWFEKH